MLNSVSNKDSEHILLNSPSTRDHSTRDGFSARLICATVLLWLASLPVHAEQPLRIAVADDIIDDYQLFIGERDPLTLIDYSGPHSRRDVVELVLLQQALALGGFSHPIQFVDEASYRRVLRQMVSGEVISTGASKWLRDLDPLGQSIYISDPLIRDGEFLVGIFGVDARIEAGELNDRELFDFTVITNPHWRSDIQALADAGFGHIVFGADWQSMLRMLHARRGDLVAAPFPNTEDLRIIEDDMTLVPARHVRLSIPGSRHWPVSKTHPLGADFFKAMQSGLNMLREQGRITRAYQQAGFFNTQTEQWPVLTATKKPPEGGL